MGLSYIELLDGIKMNLFSGDHSGLYMLVCAVACICASFSLISWYNKMLNEPYGQLDISAVIKTVTVLILICNFYSLVLIPFDFMTGIITKGLTAYVDNDDSGMIGKFASLLESAEAEYESNTLSLFPVPYFSHGILQNFLYESHVSMNIFQNITCTYSAFHP